MFASESGTDTAIGLIQRLFPPQESKGNLVISRRRRHAVDRCKVPADRAILFARQSHCFSGLRISTATYVGKDVLLNLSQTRVVSFQVPYRRLDRIAAPIDLVERLSWRLRSSDIPQFSAVLAERTEATLLWLLDEALGPDDFYDGSVITQGLDRALGSLATEGSMARLSDMLRMPVGNSSGDSSCSLYTIGALPSVSRRHLYERALKRLTGPELDGIRKAGELLKELRELFFERLMDHARAGTETHWYWLSALSAVLAPFTDSEQHLRCLVAVAESLAGKRWSVLSGEQLPGWNVSYASGVEIIRQNSMNGYVRMPEGQFWIQHPSWIPLVAAGLRVSQREATELHLTHLLPPGMSRGLSFYLRTPPRHPVGYEDFVPAGRLLLRAA